MSRLTPFVPRRARLVALVLVVAAGLGLLLGGVPGDGAPARSPTSPDMTHADRPPNRLAREKSPYLLQHAYNPVDWHPWGEEAFAKAKREDKPIFLSIGYSTCHWCHVMERESFESDTIAALLREHFIAIKVDREERPDVDRIYMTAMQALGQGGGWPLNVFLTPELEPFFGGTYFPPETRPGRIGMIDLLPRVAAAWRDQREQIEDTGGRVLAALAALAAPDSGATDRAPLFEQAFRALERVHDPEHGGFGGAPKFPSVANLDFLLRHAVRAPEARERALALARAQLDAMRAGGIHDHLGGGFHRYATDREWLVPHFEKMLYDQAQLAWAYLDAHQITGEPAYAATARGIFDYVARDLSSPEGAFLSAEDADSEGEEGKFYVWTPAQIRAALDADAAALAIRHWGVTERGNFEHGTTILTEAEPLERTAEAMKLDLATARRRLEAARAALLAARARRVRPHLDDKVLASWNGLMIAACARGARVLGDPALAARAARAGEFVWARLRDPSSGALVRRWRDGEAAGAGQLDDHAYVAFGFLELHQATHDPRWLVRAEQVTRVMLERFWDDAGGGFWETPGDDPSVRVRMKDGFDGAELAGNSIAAWVLQTLAVLLDRDDWRAKATRAFDAFARRLAGGPTAMPRMLVAMMLEQSGGRHVVVAGEVGAADTRALVETFDRRFLPNDVLLVTGGAARAALEPLVPFATALPRQNGRATAYVCVNYACRLPVSDPAAFARQLDEPLTAPTVSGGQR